MKKKMIYGLLSAMFMVQMGATSVSAEPINAEVIENFEIKEDTILEKQENSMFENDIDESGIELQNKKREELGEIIEQPSVEEILERVKISTRSENFAWQLHVATNLHETDSEWRFLLGDYNRDGIQDLYAMNKRKKEIHILNGADEFQSFLAHLTTKLGSGVWDFAIGDYNKDGYVDIYALATSQTSSKTTEVHVLDGKNNYQSYLMQTKTTLHETDSNWEFEIGDFNKDGKLDIYAINKSKKEIHILNGENNFQSYLANTTTKLGNNKWDFGLNDYNNDGYLDLYCLAKTNTGSGKTEIHILDGSKGFQNYLLQQPTPEGLTNDDWEFLVGPGKVNIYGITKKGTGSKKTEVHQFISTGSTEGDVNKRSKVVDLAYDQIDDPYIYGATGPDAFDCSGLTSYVYRHALNMEIGRTTWNQMDNPIGRRISLAEAKPGDLIFTYGGDHVGIYIGNNEYINSPQPGEFVKVSKISSFYTARSFID